jgi:DNA-binding MarR family transcriptional regulator
MTEHQRSEFDFSVYPVVPGAKGSAETSYAAAADIADKAPRIRQRVLSCIALAGDYGCTPEEAAEQLGLARVTVQPGFSELKAAGSIRDSGKRRRNPSSGKRAVVWVLADRGGEARQCAVPLSTTRRQPELSLPRVLTLGGRPASFAARSSSILC